MAEDMFSREKEGEKSTFSRGWLGTAIRFIVAAVVLLVTAWLTPGFEMAGFGIALLAALVIAVMDFAIQKLFKIDASPFGRGVSGFFVAALIIYLTQFIVPGMSVNVLGAIIAALVIGIIDSIVPAHLF